MSSPRTVDWSTIRNPFGKTLAPPLELFPRSDGSLGRRSFAGWDDLAGSARSVNPEPTTHFHDRAADGWRLDASDGRMDVLASAEPIGDARTSGTLTLDARHGGLAFRFGDDGSGYELALRPGSSEVVLRKWLSTTDRADGCLGYRLEELQREDGPRPILAGEPLPFVLLTIGPYVEVSLLGEVVLATFTAERASGPWGIWAESGLATLADVQVESMERP